MKGRAQVDKIGRHAVAEWEQPPEVAGFVAFMRRRELTEATIARRLFTLYVIEHQVGPLLEVDAAKIDRFLDERAISGRTRVCWVSHLNAFYRWAQADDRVVRNPAAALARPKLRRQLPRPVPIASLDHALRTARTPLLRTWIALGGYAGLRCMEIAGLQRADVDLVGGSLIVMGKGARERKVPMHPVVRAELGAWLADNAGPATAPAFVDPSSGDAYLPQTVSRQIGRSLQRSGIDATAHQLRHSFASMLLSAGAAIEVVAELLGHESLENTRIYGEVDWPRMRDAVDLLAVLDDLAEPAGAR